MSDACTHGQRWDALKRAIRNHTSVYFMSNRGSSSKQRARQVPRALEATAKAAKVRFLLSPPLAFTACQVAQARLQDNHTDRAAAAAGICILWQQ